MVHIWLKRFATLPGKRVIFHEQKCLNVNIVKFLIFAKCNIDIFKFLLNQGTGKWTAISALDCGMPVTLIGESVFARCLSSLKNERIKASKVLKGPSGKTSLHVGDVNQFIEDVRQALYASKIISYAQGFMLLRQAAKVCIAS